MSFAEIPLRFSLLKRESNLDAHLRWIAYIASPEFLQAWKDSAQTKGNLEKMIVQAREVVEEDIYSLNTTDGTGRIKDSMSADYLDLAYPAWALYSDPSVAPSKGPFESGNPSDFSYAAFFEDPEFNSFIPPRDDPFHPKRYRPFFEDMTKRQRKLSLDIAYKSLLRTIQKRMPRT